MLNQPLNFSKKMKFYEEEVNKIVLTLKNGGVIVYPTDTIWGIGCDIFNEIAVRNTFKIKKRPFEKKMSLLVSDAEMLRQYTKHIPARIDSLNDYYERPVTVIYNTPMNLPDYLLEKDGSVAIRIVKDDFCASVIKAFGKPILSSSANIGGEPFPSNFSEISPILLEQVDYIVKYRQSDFSKNAASIMIKLNEKQEFEVIRD